MKHRTAVLPLSLFAAAAALPWLFVAGFALARQGLPQGNRIIRIRDSILPR